MDTNFATGIRLPIGRPEPEFGGIGRAHHRDAGGRTAWGPVARTLVNVRREVDSADIGAEITGHPGTRA